MLVATLPLQKFSPVYIPLKNGLILVILIDVEKVLVFLFNSTYLCEQFFDT